MSVFTVMTFFLYLNGNFFGACCYKCSAGPCVCEAEVMSGRKVLFSILDYLTS